MVITKTRTKIVAGLTASTSEIILLLRCSLLVLLLAACGKEQPRESIQQLRQKHSGVQAEMTLELGAVVDNKLKQLHKRLQADITAKSLPLVPNLISKQSIVFQFTERKDFAAVKEFIGARYRITEKSAAVGGGVIQYHLIPHFSETRGHYNITLTLDANARSAITKTVNAQVVHNIRQRLQALKPRQVIIERLSVRRLVIFIVGVNDTDKVHNLLRDNQSYSLAVLSKSKADKNDNETDDSGVEDTQGNHYQIVVRAGLHKPNLLQFSSRELPDKKIERYEIKFGLTPTARKRLASQLADTNASLAILETRYIASPLIEGDKVALEINQSRSLLKLLPAQQLGQPFVLTDLTRNDYINYNTRLNVEQYPVPVHVGKRSVILIKVGQQSH